MTSEIIVMNKNGLALAADSAVTRQNLNRPAHYQTKLFALSDHHAAGIMLHDRMQLNNIPVETIIKMFQSQIPNEAHSNFSEYSENFVNFIQNNSQIFAHDKSNLTWVYDVLGFLQRFGRDIYATWADQSCDHHEKSLRQYTLHCIQQKIEQLNQVPVCFMQDTKNLRRRLTCEIQKFGEYYIDNIFNLVPLTLKIRSALYELLYLLTIKENFELGQTGIVLAGYGRDDIFPSAVYLQLGGIYFNQLKYNISPIQSINYKNHAQIIPYAMKDSVSSFIKGVHPSYELYSLMEFKNCLRSGLEACLPLSETLNADDLTPMVEEHYQDYRQKLKRHVLTNHIHPVVESIKFLPCDDLAFIAETLVNISSFQTSIMPGQDFIGGQVNVATIAKGDGFNWIKKSGGDHIPGNKPHRLRQI